MKSILIGYGYWGHILERYIRQSKEFELLGIYSPHYENSVQWDWVIESGVVECAFVCAPIEKHFSIVKQLLESRIHVFCEKPLCKSYADTMELYQVAERKKTVLFVDYIYAVSRTLTKIKEHIHDFGKICYIDLNISQYGKFYQTDNVFEVIGVHMLTTLIFLLDAELGDVEIRQVDVKKRNMNSISEAGVVLLNVCGIPGKMECSLWSPEKKRRVEVLCEDGMLVFDMLADDTLQVYDRKNSLIMRERIDEQNNLKYILGWFMQTIRDVDLYNKSISLQIADALDQIGGFSK